MKNKLASLLTAIAIVASMPLFISAAPEGKVTLCHNGHAITISVNALQKHLDNHNKADAKLTCFIVTPDHPCTGESTNCGCAD